MTEPNQWDDISITAPVPPPNSAANPWDEISAPAASTPVGSSGFLGRVAAGLNKVPRDIVDEFMEGIHTTLRAPGQILGIGGKPEGFDDLGPKMEEELRRAGYSPDGAKRESARLLRSMERQQGAESLLLGPLQAITAPFTGPIRSFLSRPIEETTGFPKEVTEGLTMAGLAAVGMTRVRVRSDGSVKAEPVGKQPADADFQNATRALLEGKGPGEAPIIDLNKDEYSVVPDMGTVETNLRNMWRGDGIHPAEAVNDAPNDPFLRQQLALPDLTDRSGIPPVQGSPVPPGTSRSLLAQTGEPHIDQILNHPVLKRVIDNPVIDDTHTIPNSWGGSVPLENPVTYIDKDFPRSLTVDGVTFDPADAAAVHENVEQMTMDILTKGGMDRATALKVAFWEYGEKAEDAFYRAHGMDPATVERVLAPIVDAIAARRANDIPPDLFRGTYPDGDPAKAAPGPVDKPTAAEIRQAKEIVAAVQPITAYHGSPYSFDAFDIGKIGKGEGAQAYGHGLYFAENSEVAKDYQKTLAGTTKPDQRFEQAVSDYEVAKAEIDAGRSGSTPEFDAALLRDLKAEIEKWRGLVAAPEGALYQVRIHADRDMMFDYDKPNDKQSSGVQAALKKLGLSDQYVGRIVNDPEVVGRLREEGVVGVQYLDQGSRGNPDAIGKQLQEVRDGIASVEKQTDSPTQADRLANLRRD